MVKMVSHGLFQIARFLINLLSHESSDCPYWEQEPPLLFLSLILVRLYCLGVGREWKKFLKAFIFFKDRPGSWYSRVTDADWETLPISTVPPSTLTLLAFQSSFQQLHSLLNPVLYSCFSEPCRKVGVHGYWFLRSTDTHFQDEKQS